MRLRCFESLGPGAYVSCSELMGSVNMLDSLEAGEEITEQMYNFKDKEGVATRLDALYGTQSSKLAEV